MNHQDPSCLPMYIVYIAACGTNLTFMIKWHVGFHHSLYFVNKCGSTRKINSSWCSSHHGSLIMSPLYKMTRWYKKHSCWIAINAVGSAVVSSKAKPLWPPYTSTKVINVLLLFLFFLFVILFLLYYILFKYHIQVWIN